MFKKLFQKKENKGYVSVEVIIIAAIILSLFAFLFLRWSKTADDLSTSTIVGMQQQVDDMKDPNTGESFIDMSNDTTTLLAQTLVKTKPFTFEKSLENEQTYTFTVDNLNKIKNITASNGGVVEIVSTNGNEVTIKVTGGEITESIVVAGEYIAYDEKVVTAQDSPTYNDGVYSGTLKQYLHSGEASKFQTVSEKKTYTSLSAIPTTNTYNVAGYNGTLSKTDEVEQIVVSGTPTATKEVTATITQAANSFANTKTHTDGEYAGTLTKSGSVVATVVSGQASVSKSVTTTVTKSSNNFDNTITYNQDGYTGTLSKSGDVASTLISGTASDSKSVSQTKTSTSNNFASTLSYNQDGYSGTLSKGTVTSRVTGTVSDGYWSSRYVSSGYYTQKWVSSGYYDTYSYQEWVSNYVSVKVGTETYQSGTKEVAYDQCFGINSQHMGGTITGTASGSRDGCVMVYYEQPVYSTRDVYETQDRGGYVTRSGREWVDTSGYQSVWVDTSGYENYWVDTSYNTYEYTTTYTGTVTRPDTRVYEHKQTYTGTVATLDTRVWSYEQAYTGTLVKPDTRVYNYVQTYTGTVATPDTRVYKYQGMVVRPESDTREYEHYYQYDIDVNYFEKR